MNIEYDKNKLGIEYESGPFFITEELIKKFKDISHIRSQIQEPDNLTTVPIQICNLFMPSLNKPDIKLKFGNLLFFVGQTIDFLSDIKIGDSLTATTNLAKVYSKTGRSGKMVFIEWDTNFKTQSGNLVSNIKESFVKIKV